MDVSKTHHIDSSEPDENGLYDYYYEYDIYEFSNGADALIARSYANEPHLVSFLHFQIAGDIKPISTPENPLLTQAIDYLKNNDAKTAFHYLSDTGYNAITP